MWTLNRSPLWAVTAPPQAHSWQAELGLGCRPPPPPPLCSGYPLTPNQKPRPRQYPAQHRPRVSVWWTRRVCDHLVSLLSHTWHKLQPALSVSPPFPGDPATYHPAPKHWALRAESAGHLLPFPAVLVGWSMPCCQCLFSEWHRLNTHLFNITFLTSLDGCGDLLPCFAMWLSDWVIVPSWYF